MNHNLLVRAMKGNNFNENTQSPTTPTNSILTSMLSFERFLFLLRYGFAYVERTIELEYGTKTERLEKHIMRYQQMFAESHRLESEILAQLDTLHFNEH